MSRKALLCLVVILAIAVQANAEKAECTCKCNGQEYKREVDDCSDECAVCFSVCGGDYRYVCMAPVNPVVLIVVFCLNIGIAVGWAFYVQSRRRNLALPTDNTKTCLQCVACYFIPCWCCCYLGCMESSELNSRRNADVGGQGVAMGIPVVPAQGGGYPAGGAYAVGAPAYYGQGQPIYAAQAVPVGQPGSYAVPQGAPPQYPGAPAAAAPGGTFTGQPHRI